MANKMLIDATHPEETRVVVVKGDRVEEFDFESATKKQLRGNIYLAKVTRVEPSLQAAFVDYGGNRHGFLAFSEIHPDYYQIPIADRQALAEQEAEDERIEASAENEALDSDEDEGAKKPAPKRRGRRRKSATKASDQVKEDTVASEEIVSDSSEEDIDPESEKSNESTGEDAPSVEDNDSANDSAEVAIKPDVSADTNDTTATPEVSAGDEPVISEATEDKTTADGEPENQDDGVTAVQEVVEEEEDETVESIGAEDALEEVPIRPRRRARRYKIQEVIKRNQVLLVQVVKEERGNKGAALTTYMSIAGRYCVLMPNTARGGGISRKITNSSDRKRLRTIASELDLPEGMGVILRTAGASRTKAEIKRDFEYLLRLWETVRDMTLKSVAPMLVYEEGSLVKRSIRDLYSKEIDEVLVSGEGAYKDAKSFMRMLMPTHAKNVQEYKDSVPIFARFNVEKQLSAMFSPQVRLKSGGYIVINQTEALVAIDVNSGKSTREHNIEATALATNLEAAAEVSRQFRLRDLAGLLVIDFIDMEEKRNNRAVERKLKECLKSDRARIQVGRISHFGLLEMSRQRLRSGVLEGSTDLCPHCEGTGVIRSTESVALHILRAIEETLQKNSSGDLRVSTNTGATLYILNSKRRHLNDIETQFGVNITIEADSNLTGVDHAIERLSSSGHLAPQGLTTTGNSDSEDQSKGRRRGRRDGRARQATRDNIQKAAETESVDDQVATSGGEGDEKNISDGERKRGRRRGRRGGRGRRNNSGRTPRTENDASEKDTSENGDNENVENVEIAASAETTASSDDNQKPSGSQQADNIDTSATEAKIAVEKRVEVATSDGDAAEEKPKKRAPRRRAPRRKKAETEAETTSSEDTSPSTAEEKSGEDAKSDATVEGEAKLAKAPVRRRRTRATTKKKAGTGDQPAASEAKDPEPGKPAAPAATSAPESSTEPEEAAPEKKGPPRRGWWRRAAN